MKRGWSIKKHFMWLDDTSDVELTEEQKIKLREWYKKFEPITKEDKDK